MRRVARNNNESDVEDERGAEEIEDNLDKQKTDVANLRSLVVNNQNMEAIKSILLSTIQYCTTLLNDNAIDLKKEFPFFFIYAELVRLKQDSI